MSSIKLSAIICTHNRSGFLKKAILSLKNQSVTDNDYEIIVVDNVSTDDTKELVLGLMQEVRNLHYVYESELGLSHARNRGIREAKGEIVAFLDDDAIASPKWIETILHVFKTVEPMPGCVGGKIDLIWEAPRPVWLSDRMRPCLGYLDMSDKPTILGKNHWIGGGNIAFPKNILDKLGGFEAGLGRIGSKLLSNEEIYLLQRIRYLGYNCWYHPDMLIHHHVLASRLNKKWFKSRYYWQGVSMAITFVYQESPSIMMRCRLGILAILAVLLRVHWILISIIPTDNPVFFRWQCYMRMEIGYIFGLIGVAK